MGTVGKKWAWILCCFLCCCMLAGCRDGGERYQRYSITNFSAFDTVSQISAYAAEDPSEYLDALNVLLEEWHQLFDIYENYDGINNMKTINDNAGKKPVRVDERIIGVMEKGIEMERVTGGRCNIAFGSVLSIWHDYRQEGLADQKAARLPPVKLLKEAARHTNISDIVIDREKKTVYLKDSEMSLDVGAIAKGFAADALAEKAQELGMDSVMLNLGGNVRTVGNKKDSAKGSDWIAGIQNPNGESDISYLYKLPLNHMSLVTSGDYQRFYEVDGKRYSHIVDPETLFPAEKYRSVTIYTEESGIGDALSTALFIADLETGKQILSDMDAECEALWVLPDGSVEMTDGMEGLVEANQ